MTRINVKVIPNSEKNKVFGEGGLLKVYVKSPPIDNKANKESIKILSEIFKVRKSNIKIIQGLKSRNKIIEIIK